MVVVLSSFPSFFSSPVEVVRLRLLLHGAL